MNESSEAIKRVAKEGLEARNLVNWISDASPDDMKTTGKPPSSPKPKLSAADVSKDIDTQLLMKTKRRGTLSRPKSRLRSASAGRNPEKDLRARYWTFLFENLHRAVDEIYQTCEMDESIVESKEAIMMLENYSKDFHSLIQYININKNYEKTAPINRPTSLAWEVRKSSPGKSLLKNVFIEKLTAGNSQAKRILCFDASSDCQNFSNTESSKLKAESKPPVITESKESSCEKESISTSSTCPTECLNIKDCAITISVMQETNEVFPCNEGLVVNEVLCSSEISEDQPSIIVESESKMSNLDCVEVSLKDSIDECKIHAGVIPADECKHVTVAVPAEECKNAVVIPVNESKTMAMINSANECKNHGETIPVNEYKNLTEVISTNETKLEAFVINSDEKLDGLNTLSEVTEIKVVGKENEISENSLIESISVECSSEKCDMNRKDTEDTDEKIENKENKNTTNSLKDTSNIDLNSKILKSNLKNEESSNTSISDHISISSSSEKKAPLKRKVLVKKSSKGSNEKINTSHSVCRQSISTEEKSNLKSNVKNTASTFVKASEKDKITVKTTTVTKECDNIMKKETEDTAASIKPVANITLAKRVAAKSTVEKSTNTPLTKTPISKPVSAVRKVSTKVESSSEEKKSAKTYSRPSAIQRNISYVSSLSSRNQQEKAATEEKKKPTRTISHAVRLPPQKSGSMSSLHKITAARRWSDKASSVEQIPEIIKSNADEDSDGWEMVRGRNRCRNSPAKKIPFSSERNDKVLDMAKLNQSRFGGFPYTTKNSAKGPQNKVLAKKDSKFPNKEKQSKSETNISKSNHLDIVETQNNSTSKKPAPINFIKGDSNNGLNKAKEVDMGKVIFKADLIVDDCKMDFSAYDLNIPKDICHKIECKSFKSNLLTKSDSLPCLNDYCKNTFFCKIKSLSEQSLPIKKRYGKMKHSRNSVEKSFNSAWKKCRKSTKSQDFTTEKNGLNTSLDESDTGLTSDDQDGQTSHDEAYDAQCQELYDTAWKYKILEQQVHKLELSWGEQMDRFDMELRTPGRALEMHEKLSSPFRKKSLMESIRLQEEKQVKAREQRERLLEEKLQKIKEIEKKRQEMRTLVEQRQEKQRVLMEQKLQRAEEKRKKQLQIIIRKAHDEEEKVNEIAFINSLEAQNKRHDLISKEKDHEARLHDIQEERQRKQEEKAAKEAAAEERRKLLEAERQARLNEMQEKRKIRDHKVEQLFLVKEKERQELANQKARDREQRLSALNAQQQISIEELQKKIQLKQEESARRHEENMEQIRQKAFELSVRRCSSNNDDAPQPVPYETKKICTLCNVLIGSEVYLLSHLRGKKHQETVKDQYQGKDPSVEELELYNLKHIVDASTDQLDPNIAFDKERQKALKKRCKKLRQRMCNRGQEYEAQLEKSTDTVNSNVKTKMSKIITDIKKLITTYEKCTNENNLLSTLDRCLKETDNVLEKKLSKDKVAFREVGGLGALIDIFKLVSTLRIEKSVFLHKKVINNLSITAESIVEKCYENCLYILFSNKIGCLLDLLIQRLNIIIPNNYNQMIATNSKSPGPNLQVDVTAGKLMHFLSKILLNLADKSAQYNKNIIENTSQKENQSSEFQFRVQDVISYTVSIGIVDKLSQYFNSIQGPIGNEEEVANYLLDCIAFLTSIIKLYSNCFMSNNNSKTDDSTQLVAAIKVTNMIGTVSLLYGLLLHSGASSRDETPPPQLPKQIESLTFSTLCMINNIAVMNLQAFQTILGSEGLSLQLRHITSHLLWYCSHWTSDILLHEVILLVGYFTVLNVDNQSLIQAGQRPTVLQQLCSLPFLYFSDSELTDILFPTLIACCYKNSSNKTILEQEMSSELLSNYIEVKYLSSEECSSKAKNVVPEKRWLFSTRFPKSCWTAAKHYFAVK